MLPGIPPSLSKHITNDILPGLDSIRGALAAVGEPQFAYPTVLIGGTNGKGSTTAFLSKMLQGQGLKVGTFTSPSLGDFRDHMQINGRSVDGLTLESLSHRLLENWDGRLTAFEMATCLSFLLFENAEVDVALVEVGMGGRFDCTNVCEPCLSILTTLGEDHQRWLGHTLAEIAQHKGGICRPGRPFLLGATQEQIQILKDVSPVATAKCFVVGRDFGCQEQGSECQLWVSEKLRANKGIVFEGLKLGLHGAHQAHNASLALAAVAVLEPILALSLNNQRLRASLEETALFGRLTKVGRFWIDGAHNKEGAIALAKAIPRVIGPRVLLILAVFADKDVEQIVRHLCPQAYGVYCVPLANPRALDPEALAAIIGEQFPQLPCQSVDSLKRALLKTRPDELVLVAGSLSLAAQLLAEQSEFPQIFGER